MDEIVIVTRHEGLVKWLASRGIKGRVIVQVKPEDIVGKDVYGNLPLHLAATTRTISTVDMNLPFDKRGQDLSEEEMDKYNPILHTYQVREVNF